MSYIRVFLFVGLLLVAELSQAETQPDEQHYSQAELEQLLAPIALYPDTLLTHILAASTYPLDVIKAYRWRNELAATENDQILTLAHQQPWDPSVKALLAFPRVLQTLHDDLAWTEQLGDAFLVDQQKLLASVQQLRQQAEAAGGLQQLTQVEVIRERDTIIIEPTHTEVVYVPVYNSDRIYGDWRWPHYPPINWHVNHWHIDWHDGVWYSFGLGFSHVNWRHKHIVINRDYWDRRDYDSYRHYGFKRYRYFRNNHHVSPWRHHKKVVRHYSHRNEPRAISKSKQVREYQPHIDRKIRIADSSSRKFRGAVVTEKQPLKDKKVATNRFQNADKKLTKVTREQLQLKQRKNNKTQLRHAPPKIVKAKSKDRHYQREAKPVEKVKPNVSSNYPRSKTTVRTNKSVGQKRAENKVAKRSKSSSVGHKHIR